MNDRSPTGSSNYLSALGDFHEARRRANLEAIISRITGKPTDLMQYDEIRRRFKVVESAEQRLEEIPLDAIVGTVGRYSDFTRSLLPLKENDGTRWAKVKTMVENMEGLPPIEVYKVGDVYFILDGHHRASVARQVGATHIQAYVRNVYMRVPLSPNDKPDDVIIKSEFADFLAKTHLDELRPNSNLMVTAPGEFAKLLEHISVHRYYMGIDQKRPITYEEAVTHWYDTVYLPIAEIIRQRKVMVDFPGRTEADLYLWIMDHRVNLENNLGWKVTPKTAATDLTSRFSPTIKNNFSRWRHWIGDKLTPDPLEAPPPAGLWREQHDPAHEQGLFDSILVPVPGDENGWLALDMAIQVAKTENSVLGGLHVVQNKQDLHSERVQKITEEFSNRCKAAGVLGSLVTEVGPITRTLYDRSFYADLVVFRLNYPPPHRSLQRLGSGVRLMIRRSPTPLMVVPPDSKIVIKRALLAYGGGHKADEALYLASYLNCRWDVDLTVVAVDRGRQHGEDLIKRADTYLKDHCNRNTQLIVEHGDAAQAILRNCESGGHELIIMGGYEGGVMREMLIGSTVDRVLSNAKCAVLICR